jgi:hypothetical protein
MQAWVIDLEIMRLFDEKEFTAKPSPAINAG